MPNDRLSGVAGQPFNATSIAALTAWMADHVACFEGPVHLEKFAGGQSNPTYKIETPARSYVLRCKPKGELLKGAHAVDREARVQQALATVAFPVATIHGLCTDTSVLGTWFYVMDLVDGRIFWDSTFSEMPPTVRALYLDAMNETLATLHMIDPQTVGLGDYGRPADYFQRQIARWTQQYQADAAAGKLADMDMLAEWLPANIPADTEPARIVHGDYRVDNLIFHPSEPRVIAVLDWELSTLGHPLADFTYHLMMYRAPSTFAAGMADRNILEMGLPGEHAYIDAYCRRTGRAGIEHLDFYMAYNLFRFAAIVHGIKGRAMRGNAASSSAHLLVNQLTHIAALARRQITGAGAG